MTLAVRLYDKWFMSYIKNMAYIYKGWGYLVPLKQELSDETNDTITV